MGLQRRKGHSPSRRVEDPISKKNGDVGENNKKNSQTKKRIIATIGAMITIVIIIFIDPNPNANSISNPNKLLRNPVSTTIAAIITASSIKHQQDVAIQTTTTDTSHDTTSTTTAKIVNTANTENITSKVNIAKTVKSKQRQAILSDPSTITKARDQIESIRKEFEDRYGGTQEANEMLKRGVQTSGTTDVEKEKSLNHTAERIILAALKQSPKSSSDRAVADNNSSKAAFGKFTMSFGGYSVTVGRGNYFAQSYPFVLQKILSPIFQTLDMDLVVRNSAIGGIPSFPYGWCLPNFLGVDSDVVGWDYGMNEGGGAEAFEAYVRQTVFSLPKRPMMVMLDTKNARVNLLHQYHKNGVLLDSIAVGKGEVVNKGLLKVNEAERLPGLRKWDQWGSPPGSPGQNSWHPKYMEHELIAWMMAAHFLDPLEKALKMLEGGFDIDDTQHQKLSILPEPMTTVDNNNPDETVPFLLYGKKVKDEKMDVTTNAWQMDHISCRTSFLPNLDGHMSSIVVSGVFDDKGSIHGDELSSRDDEEYKNGWVSDVGKIERETKRKVEKIGGLGYIDMKLALYGIKESGPLRLWLPHPHGDLIHSSDSLHNNVHIGGDATHWFETLVFCEVNEKRGDKECKMTSDMSFVIGGVPASSVVHITDAASYLNKHICVNVKIPNNAKITERKDVEPIGDNKGHMEPMEGKDSLNVGLIVDVTVTSDTVTRKDGACSISHVVWQSL